MNAAPQPKKTPSRRRTASDQVAPALLHAAQTVLDRDGQPGVTIRAVASQAAVSPMSVYNRFGSREGLLIVLAGRAFADLAEALATPADMTPEQRFRQICRVYRAFALTHPERYSLIFSVGSPVKLPDSDEASGQGRQAFEYLVDAVEALHPLPHDGQETDSAAEGAQIVWNALHGAVTIERANIGRTDTPGKTYEHMITVLLRGLRNTDERMQ